MERNTYSWYLICLVTLVAQYPMRTRHVWASCFPNRFIFSRLPSTDNNHLYIALTNVCFIFFQNKIYQNAENSHDAMSYISNQFKAVTYNERSPLPTKSIVIEIRSGSNKSTAKTQSTKPKTNSLSPKAQTSNEKVPPAQNKPLVNEALGVAWKL